MREAEEAPFKKTTKSAIRKLHGKRVQCARYTSTGQKFFLNNSSAGAGRWNFRSYTYTGDATVTEPMCISRLMDSEGREIKSNRTDFISDGPRLNPKTAEKTREKTIPVLPLYRQFEKFTLCKREKRMFKNTFIFNTEVLKWIKQR